MGKIEHKNGQVGSGVALNMIKANSSQPFSLTSSPVNKGRGKQDRKVRKAVKTSGQLIDMSMAEFGETGGPNNAWLGDKVNRKYERKVKKLDKTIKQIDKSKNRRDKSENTLKAPNPTIDSKDYVEYRQLPRSVAPLNQGDGSRLKKKINKLSDKHAGLYSSVIEGEGQNEYTSGDYDKDYKKLGKVEDRLKRNEEKYQEKFGKSPYASEISEEFKEVINKWQKNSTPLNKEGWIQEATESIKRRGTEGVCTGDKFGSASCPPGSKRYNLAKTFKKMAKNRK